MIAIIGIGDQPCWLAEAYKISSLDIRCDGILRRIYHDYRNKSLFWVWPLKNEISAIFEQLRQYTINARKFLRFKRLMQ